MKKKLIIRFGNHPSFNFEGDTRTNESLHAANIMVSDWSGVALEFAFGLEKPVVFIDKPLKLNNAEYSRLKSVPLEILLREKIGRILPAEDIKKLPSVVAELAASPEDFEMRVKELRESFARFCRNILWMESIRNYLIQKSIICRYMVTASKDLSSH